MTVQCRTEKEILPTDCRRTNNDYFQPHATVHECYDCEHNLCEEIHWVKSSNNLCLIVQNLCAAKCRQDLSTK